jgi:hypothetical protein
MRTGSAPQSKVITPPVATAAASLACVHVAAVPEPTRVVGLDVSAALASGGKACVHLPSRFPAGCAAGQANACAVPSQQYPELTVVMPHAQLAVTTPVAQGAGAVAPPQSPVQPASAVWVHRPSSHLERLQAGSRRATITRRHGNGVRTVGSKRRRE